MSDRLLFPPPGHALTSVALAQPALTQPALGQPALTQPALGERVSS